MWQELISVFTLRIEKNFSRRKTQSREAKVYHGKDEMWIVDCVCVYRNTKCQTSPDIFMISDFVFHTLPSWRYKQQDTEGGRGRRRMFLKCKS